MKDDNDPLTKGEFRKAQRNMQTTIDDMQISIGNTQTSMGDMQTTIDSMKTSVADMQTSMGDMKETLTSVLNIVQSLDEGKTEFNAKRIPERVTANEEDILKIKAKLA